MIRIPGKIPIIIHPTFWLLCLFVGFIYGYGNVISILMWVGIVFISVLFHEMGHAVTALFFGRKPRIELVALGGLTYHDGSALPLWKQFLITLNGPVFGFLLALMATALLHIPNLMQNPPLFAVIKWLQIVNFFWTLVNLLPVAPLDGGQLLRIVLEGIFGIKGIQYAALSSAVIALLMSLICFLFHSFLVGVFFFLFAYQGYEMWRQSKMMAASDAKESMKQTFEQAERAMAEGHKVEAASLFEKIRNEAKEGLLYVLATQYLAFFQYEKGKAQEAYDLLYPIRSMLNGDSLILLHRVAFEVQNYALVTELAGSIFQSLPNVETALRNAYSSAFQGQVQPAIGWLETAHQEGLQNIKEIAQENAFDSIRDHEAFQKFIRSFN